MTTFQKSATLLLIASLFAGFAAAQSPSGTIVGRIVDSSSAAVIGATVRVHNVDTNEVRTTATKVDGEYTVAALQPGNYEVTVEKEGFKMLRQEHLVLQVGQTARVDGTLQVGATTTSVDVEATVPLVNTETSSRGDVIAPAELTQMPLNGRDFNDLAFLVAGVQAAEQGGKGSPYVVNGARADASNVTIDGFNDQNPRDAGAQARPPLESLQEFKLQTSGYSAEYGRLAGGVVTMALKSGGNTPHGALFEYLRNDMFGARNFFDADKSKLRRNQFGASFSGPVVLPKIYNGHDKTFFLGSWESFRGIAGTSQLGLIPTLQERQGDFSQTFGSNGKLTTIKDPLTGAAFAGNVIPANRISPIAKQIANLFPTPNIV